MSSWGDRIQVTWTGTSWEALGLSPPVYHRSRASCVNSTRSRLPRAPRTGCRKRVPTPDAREAITVPTPHNRAFRSESYGEVAGRSRGSGADSDRLARRLPASRLAQDPLPEGHDFAFNGPLSRPRSALKSLHRRASSGEPSNTSSTISSSSLTSECEASEAAGPSGPAGERGRDRGVAQHLDLLSAEFREGKAGGDLHLAVERTVLTAGRQFNHGPGRVPDRNTLEISGAVVRSLGANGTPGSALGWRSAGRAQAWPPFVRRIFGATRRSFVPAAGWPPRWLRRVRSAQDRRRRDRRT